MTDSGRRSFQSDVNFSDRLDVLWPDDLHTAENGSFFTDSVEVKLKSKSILSHLPCFQFFIFLAAFRDLLCGKDNFAAIFNWTVGVGSAEEGDSSEEVWLPSGKLSSQNFSDLLSFL